MSGEKGKRYRLHFSVEVVVNDPQTGLPWSESAWVLRMRDALRAAALKDPASLEVAAAWRDVELEP